MRLDKAIGDYKAAFRHNPKHFYSNSFRVDRDLLGRKVVTGRPRRGQKNYKVVAILKPPKKGW